MTDEKKYEVAGFENQSADTQRQHIIFRLDALEKAQHGQATNLNTLKVEIGKELGALDRELKGVREQARMHNEASVRSIEALKTQMTALNSDTQSLVGTMGKELQGALDKLIRLFNIDEDPDAMKEMRKDLVYMRTSRLSRDGIAVVVRNALVAAVVGGFITICLAGAYKIISTNVLPPAAVQVKVN